MDLILKLLESKLHSNGLNWLKLMDFRLSSKTRTISAEVYLEGEDKPLSLEATYLLEGENLVITTVVTGKRWMTEGLNLALAKTGGRIELPTGLKGKMIRMFL